MHRRSAVECIAKILFFVGRTHVLICSNQSHHSSVFCAFQNENMEYVEGRGIKHEIQSFWLNRKNPSSPALSLYKNQYIERRGEDLLSILLSESTYLILKIPSQNRSPSSIFQLLPRCGGGGSGSKGPRCSAGAGEQRRQQDRPQPQQQAAQPGLGREQQHRQRRGELQLRDGRRRHPGPRPRPVPATVTGNFSNSVTWVAKNPSHYSDPALPQCNPPGGCSKKTFS